MGVCTSTILNNIQQLRHALIYEWNNIPQNHVANNIGPMRHRCAIQANGEYMKYWQCVKIEFGGYEL